MNLNGEIKRKTAVNGQMNRSVAPGPPGPTGATPDIQIGNVTTGQPGSSAAASMTGTPEEPILNLTIPRGDRGEVGETPDISIGTVTTGEAGSSAEVSMTGTPEEPVLNLTIPRGDKGEVGDGDMIAPEYSASSSYAVGDHVFHDEYLYRCNTAIASGGEAWNPAHWTRIRVMTDFGVLRAQLANLLNEITQNPQYAPTAEVVDIRTGYDGTVYLTAGDAVRAIGYALGDLEAELLAYVDENAVSNLSLEYDEETSMLYLTNKGEIIGDGVHIVSGGGGSGSNAKVTITNTTGWNSKTIADGSSCNLSFSWSSIEDELPTGNGTLTVRVGSTVKKTQDVAQGSVTVAVDDYLASGSNSVWLSVTDVYGNTKSLNYTINVVTLSLTSSFDASVIHAAGDDILFSYIPYGNVEKTVYIIVDGVTDGTQTVTASGRQQTYTVDGLSHGAHSLRCYFTATINGETVSSNELYYEFIVVDSQSSTPIIASSFRASTVAQYTTLAIPYMVYTPGSLTSSVTFYNGNDVVTTLTVDRTEHIWNYRVDDTGSTTLSIKTGNVVRSFTFTVTETQIDVHAETQNLALHLTSYGRSNNEAHPEVWQDADNQISCTLSDFNFVSDGWLPDNDGVTALRVSGDARVTIPYKPFQNDFRSTGKTIEVEFATRDILNYDSTIISCMSGGRGFQLTAQKAELKSEQSEISTQYKEDEHVRIAFVAEKRAENRLLYIYINGIMSGVVQYPTDDNFAQVTPVNISIGSNYCTTDIYCIRVYDNDLTRYQILDNWIADTQDLTTLLARYDHNEVYDAYGNVVIAKLPNDLPYLVISCAELPQFKGDKKTVSGYYVDPVDPSKSFTFTDAQADVQGTSSQYYPRKNYKIKFNGGFVIGGQTQAKYAMRGSASIPTKTFCFKADVASSEGANNVELVRLYESACPYKTPPQDEDDRVRQGIDGFPIVIFWDDGNTVSFIGKYNFNNDKSTDEVFGFEAGDESWEIKNNTSDRVLWKDDDFTGDDWLNDFEGRYPEDNTVGTNLAALSAWLVTTDQTAATGDALPETYTDVDGNTHTVDNAAYRLAKFKTEIDDYIEKQSAIFYYLFTELFLMVDSRAKNAFPSFLGGDKWCFLPYDMDTALGINNEGALVFDYSLEDTDHLSGGADVFNGQQSVLWINLRQAFYSDIATMYKTLRSNGKLSYSLVEGMFEAHQGVWPEAIFNEDAFYKYIAPLIEDGTGSYLAMAQGSKAEQRKWWLYNRFRYIDSKYNAGDALTDVVQLRGYAKDDITVTPYADIYPTIKYGSYLVTERGRRNTATTLVCPLDVLNDTEIYIYSASQLASIGDLSGLKVGFADFSMATRINSIKVGDNTTGYTNGNLTELYVGNNALLGSVDARNCTALTGSVDLSGATNIETVLLDGTAITGCVLPVGGILKTLSLPDTITNLTVRNQPSITTFSVENDDYSNITTLRVEGSPSIPIEDILPEMASGSRVRLIGFAMAVTSTDDVEDFFDLLDTMGGLDENGNNLANAVASGTITGLTNVTGSWIAAMHARYPNVTITYEHLSAQLKYYNYDGSELLYTETVLDGGDGAYSGTPSRTSTAQYSYTFLGWALTTNASAADATATTDVTTDRNVYAAYSATLRTYTVTWKNSNGTVLETDQNVAYGSTPSYNGSTPVDPAGTGIFNGWTPAIATVTGDAVYTATFLITYTVYFYNSSTLLETVTGVQAGGSATYSGQTPTDPDHPTYVFDGWRPSPTNIQANTSCYAQFKAPPTAPTATSADGAYGVEWNYANSSPALTRKGLAASFSDPTPATALDGSGSSPFDTISPWKDMKRYNVIDGAISYSEDDAGFSETDYDTVVYIPEFYYTAYKDETNSKWLWAISPTQLSGYVKHPGSGRYIGRFHTSGSSSGVFSKSGVAPLGNTSRPNVRTYSHNKGAKWWMIDLATWSALQMLYLVEFANFHSQSTLGTGYVKGSVGQNGGTSSALYHTLKISNDHNQYRWVEDPWSNVIDMVDGFNASDRAAYISTDNASFADNISGMTATGITLPSSDYITGLGYSEECAWAFIPNASGGGRSTYIPDTVFSNSGVNALCVGGYCGGDDGYGLFYFIAYYGAAYTNGYVGSRLIYIP